MAVKRTRPAKPVKPANAALARLLSAADAGLGYDTDEAPPPPVVPVTRTGDLWRCGDHRLLCGDATKLTDVQRALGAGHLADMGFLDPPYNVAYEGGTAAKMTIANERWAGASSTSCDQRWPMSCR